MLMIALDVFHATILEFIIPHLNRTIDKTWNVGCTKVGHPGKILSRHWEALSVVTIVMFHFTLLDIQFSQFGQLVVPLHCGHATGRRMIRVTTTSNEVTFLIEVSHNAIFQGLIYFDQGSIFGTCFGELLRVGRILEKYVYFQNNFQISCSKSYPIMATGNVCSIPTQIFVAIVLGQGQANKGGQYHKSLQCVHSSMLASSALFFGVAMEDIYILS